MHELPGEGRGRSLIEVETPAGLAEVSLDQPAAAPRALLVLGHGAGGSVDAPDLLAVTKAALASGLTVARVRQPYSVAGRRAPAPAGQLDIGWISVVDAVGGTLRAEQGVLPIVVGGRSSGARVACRTATAVGARGVLALAFPLHPPGHPEKSRAAELNVPVPLLVVQGGRDPFGSAAQFPSGVEVREIAGADHRLVAPGFDGAVVGAVEWLLAVIAGSSAPLGNRPRRAGVVSRRRT